jgi:hypothetical protein
LNRAARLGIFLLVPFLVDANDSRSAWQGPDKPVYVVTKNHYAEGFSPNGETARFTDLIAIEIYNPKLRSANLDAAYKIGEEIPLFLAGQRQGTIKINKVSDLQCDSTAAIVSTNVKADWGKDAMGLATKASGVSGHAGSQRPAKDDEKEIAKRLAMSEFRKHGVADELANAIEFEQSIVTALDGTKTKSLIAYLFIKTEVAVYEVFLIAKLDGTSASTEFARYHLMKDVEDGTDSENYRFVDQLDLDGDGTDEIVVEVAGYESEEFRILRRVKGTWVRVHVGGAGGC